MKLLLKHKELDTLMILRQRRETLTQRIHLLLVCLDNIHMHKLLVMLIFLIVKYGIHLNVSTGQHITLMHLVHNLKHWRLIFHPLRNKLLIRLEVWIRTFLWLVCCFQVDQCWLITYWTSLTHLLQDGCQEHQVVRVWLMLLLVSICSSHLDRMISVIHCLLIGQRIW